MDGVGLSSREQGLLAEWERTRKRTIRLSDVSAVLGRDARLVVHRLVRKRVLERIVPGLYAVRPFRAVGRPWTLAAVVGVELLLEKTPHYIGGLAAFTLNGLTEQQHTSLIDVFVPRSRRARDVANATVLFHRRARKVFDAGTRLVDVDGMPVRISDAERTLVDAIDQFRVVGGMTETIRLFPKAFPQVDAHKLVRDMVAIGRRSSIQRLGVLLERAAAPRRVVELLHSRVESSPRAHLLVPGAPQTGPLNRRWAIIENDRGRSP